jgi:hypothetical protein
MLIRPLRVGSRHKWLLVILVLFACTFAFGPELQFRRARQKYRMGISADAIERNYGTHLELKPSGNILGSEPTEEEKRCHPAYHAFIARDCVAVTFNDNREVIEVRKWTPLIRFWLWVRWRFTG